MKWGNMRAPVTKIRQSNEKSNKVSKESKDFVSRCKIRINVNSSSASTSSPNSAYSQNSDFQLSDKWCMEASRRTECRQSLHYTLLCKNDWNLQALSWAVEPNTSGMLLHPFVGRKVQWTIFVMCCSKTAIKGFPPLSHPAFWQSKQLMICCCF